LLWRSITGILCPFYLRKNSACIAAASAGHLEVLQWLRANGCHWDEETCSRAAEGGHLEVLQWLRANGCPWDEAACMQAAEGGRSAIYEWSRDNGPPWDEETRTLCLAAGSGHLAVLLWALASGCPADVHKCIAKAPVEWKTPLLLCAGIRAASFDDLFRV
jgi:hypothetical protein